MKLFYFLLQESFPDPDMIEQQRWDKVYEILDTLKLEMTFIILLLIVIIINQIIKFTKKKRED